MIDPQGTSSSGFGLGHILLAALTGAACGATFAYMTSPRSGEENRRRVRSFVGGKRESIARLPTAVRAAGDAAREAFGHALGETVEATRTHHQNGVHRAQRR